MTDDVWEAWADIGRRLDALAAELAGQGFSVAVRWDHPHGTVTVIVRGEETTAARELGEHPETSQDRP